MTKRLAFRLLSFALLQTALVGCPAPPDEPKPSVCSASVPCDDGYVCRIDDAKPELNACVPCERDRECLRDEMCHPIERRCRLKPCFDRECGVHDDCGLGQFCVQGKCLVGSETTREGCFVSSCADGERCDVGQRCHPVNFVCEEDLGCGGDGDCGEQGKCVVGRCELACTAATATEVCGLRRVCDDGACVDCATDTDCGSGLTCDEEKKLCVSLFSCTTNRDCKVPLVCNRLTKQCTVDPGPCVSEGDCPDEDTCQLATGKCVPRECLPDAFEPNGSLETARNLPTGSTEKLSLCENDVDYYKLPLEAGDMLQVVVNVDTLLSFDVAVLGPVGEVLAQSDFAVSAPANVAGDYFVRASSRDAYVRYGLRLTVSRGIPCTDDGDEPNDDYVHATPLLPGDWFGKQICPSNADWFMVAVLPGETVTVKMESTPLDGDLDLFLYDSDGTTPLDQSATVSETERVTSSTFTGNRVYVKVVGALPLVRNAYDLRVQVAK